MKKFSIVFLSILFLAFGASGALATSLLDDWAFNVDGAIYEYWEGDSMPTSESLDGEGLGTLTWTTSLLGNHNFIAFFDHEIDQATTTYFNEYGDTVNTPNATQSWEIDEPGYVFGDIYDNVLTGALDNTNSVPSGSEDDVSWAIGWDFTLAADETAIISLILSDIAPTTSGFYLSQTDVTTLETIYYSSSLDIQPSGAPVPEPSTMLLLGSGLIGILGYGRKKLSKT